jgi:general secretion pathway protein D
MLDPKPLCFRPRYYFYKSLSCFLLLQLSTPVAQSLAVKEQLRREESNVTLRRQLAAAAQQLENQDLLGALFTYEQILKTFQLNNSNQEWFLLSQENFADASLQYAKELIRNNKPGQARVTLDKALRLLPDHPQVTAYAKKLNDPDRFPPALTDDHIQKTNEVVGLLTQANSAQELGLYNQSTILFEKVLRLDPYNEAARRGLEKTEQHKSKYYQSAQDLTRVQSLNEVSRGFERPPELKLESINHLFGAEGSAATVASQKNNLQNKLSELILPRIDFVDAPYSSIISYLGLRSRELDPTGQGVDFVLHLNKEIAETPVTLSLTSTSFADVLRYANEVVSAEVSIDNFVVNIYPIGAAGNDRIVSKSYKVPPNFISVTAITPSSTSNADPFATASAPVTSLPRRMGAKEFLESQGIPFPEGTGASYSAGSSMLMVRNTVKNLDLIDALIEQSALGTAKQVVITVKVVEITDNKLNEFGIDWLLGNITGKLGVSGGHAGNSLINSDLAAQFPFQSAPTAPSSFLNTTTSTAIGQNIGSAALRSSGDSSILFNNIDGVLESSINQSNASRSPAAFAVAGVLTNPQFQVALRALDQIKGVDTVTQPSVVTKSGQKATLEVAREMIYPGAYEPPQLQGNGSGNAADVTVTGVSGRVIFNPPDFTVIPIQSPPLASPANPTDFKMRKVGVTLEVEPTISDDNRSVEVSLIPEITDFDGFINYGSPISGLDQVFIEDPINIGFVLGEQFVGPTEVTPNRIVQPIFSNKKVTTSVRVWDNSTIVIGGLLNDSSELIEDKIPILGDAPLLGKLFRSTLKVRKTKNILFFVNVKLVDPSGRSLNEITNQKP